MSRWERCLQTTAPDVRRAFDFTGTYRGINYLVRASLRKAYSFESYSEPDRLAWCHYIYVNELGVPAEWVERLFLPAKMERFTPSSPERETFDYMDSALAGLEWHGGITFYELVSTTPGQRVLKAGCDYQHSWDEGIEYDADGVIREAKATIDSLWQMVPGLLVWSNIDGSWNPPAASGEGVGNG